MDEPFTPPRALHEVPLCGSFRQISGELAERRVADLGCGAGDYLQFCGAGSVGVDISAANVAAARARGLQALVHDLNQPPLPLADGAFEAVLASHVLEHVHAPLLFLHECNRLLAARGHVVIGLPIEDSLYSRLRMDYYGGPEGHLYSFSPRNLSKLLRLSGFVARRFVCHVPYLGNRLSGWNQRINELLPRQLLYALSGAYWCVADKFGPPKPDAAFSSYFRG